MEKAKKESKKVVVVSKETHATLGKLCELHGSNMKELTAQMVSYFERTGIDPFDAGGTDLKEAIKGLRKENNRVIGFIRQQEKTKLDPILEELAASSVEFRQRSRELGNIGELARQMSGLRKSVEQEMSRWRHAINEERNKVYRAALAMFSDYLHDQKGLRKKSTFGGEQIRLEELDMLNREYRDNFQRLDH